MRNRNTSRDARDRKMPKGHGNRFPFVEVLEVRDQRISSETIHLLRFIKSSLPPWK